MLLASTYIHEIQSIQITERTKERVPAFGDRLNCTELFFVTSFLVMTSTKKLTLMEFLDPEAKRT